MLSIPVNVFRDPNPEVVFNISDKDLTFLISIKKTGESDFTLTVSDLAPRTPAWDTVVIVERDMLEDGPEFHKIKKEAHKRYIEQVAVRAFGNPRDGELDLLA